MFELRLILNFNLVTTDYGCYSCYTLGFIESNEIKCQPKSSIQKYKNTLSSNASSWSWEANFRIDRTRKLVTNQQKMLKMRLYRNRPRIALGWTRWVFPNISLETKNQNRSYQFVLSSKSLTVFMYAWEMYRDLCSLRNGDPLFLVIEWVSDCYGRILRCYFGHRGDL